MTHNNKLNPLACSLIIINNNTSNNILDKFDKIKLILIYYKCKTLNLTDIVQSIINYMIDTQQYVPMTKYNKCSIPNIVIYDPYITEHTTHMLLNMLLEKYDDFNRYIYEYVPNMYTVTEVPTPFLIIDDCVIVKNIVTIILTVKIVTRVTALGVTKYHKSSKEIGKYILKL